MPHPLGEKTIFDHYDSPPSPDFYRYEYAPRQNETFWKKRTPLFSVSRSLSCVSIPRSIMTGSPDCETFKKKFNWCSVVPTLNHRRSTRIASDGRFSFNNRGLRRGRLGVQKDSLIRDPSGRNCRNLFLCRHIPSSNPVPIVRKWICANHLLAIALCKSLFGQGFFSAAFVNGCYGLHKLNAASVCRTFVAPTHACRSDARALLQWF